MNNDRIVNEFQKFVELHRTYSSKDTTHKIKRRGGKGKSSYSFTGKVYQEFLRKYARVLTEAPGTELNFVECPSKDNATLFVVPIKFRQKVAHRVYFEEHIVSIVEAANKVLTKNFLVTPSELASYVTEIPRPVEIKEHEYSEEIYIYYPHIGLSEEARYYALKCLSELIVKKNIFKGIPLLNRASEVVDKRIFKEDGMMMIGSRCSGHESHYLSAVYDMNVNLTDDPEDYDLDTIVNLFSNRQYDLEGCSEFRYNGTREKAVAAFKDYAYSNNNSDVESDYDSESHSEEGVVYSDEDSDEDSDDFYEVRTRKGSNDRNAKKKNKNKKAQNKKEKKDVDIPYPDVRRHPEKTREIELAKRLILILKAKRARVKKDWQRIGFALYSVSYTLFPVFKAFSERNRKGFDIAPQDIWRMAPKHCKNYSIDTIRRWAFLDNEKKYYRILREEYEDLFVGAESCKHHDIAKVIHALYKDRFVCVDIDKRKWYEFQNHKWVVVQSAYTLEELISEDVRNMLMSYCGVKLQDLAQKGKGFKDHEYKRYVKIMNSIDNLGNTDFIGKVIKACAGKFYDANFQSLLDTDPYLVGFENGVYDLNEMAFRDGMPSDMVAKTVGYDYLEFEADDPIFDVIIKFFSQVHTDVDMREYTLTFLASILRGKPDQKAHIWTGGGGNGKSAMVDLIKRMIGDYFGVLPVTILTVKYKSSSGPKPELADKFGKRFLVIQEPEHNDTVYVGQMKEITGEDTLHARAMYGDPFEYVPMFTIVLTCNNLPHIPSTDRGTWRRLRVTPYESEFVEKNPVGPKQFLGDEELKEKFDDWVQPLVWLCLNKYYPIFKEGVGGKRYKIKEPELVTKYTNEYKKDSDFYIEFLDETFNFTDDEENTETIQFVYDTFSTWYLSSYGAKAPPKKKFIEYLNKNKIKHDKREIKGISFALGLA
jgi:Megaviricetes DNA primase